MTIKFDKKLLYYIQEVLKMIKKENVKHLLELMHFTTDDDNIYVKFFDKPTA